MQAKCRIFRVFYKIICVIQADELKSEAIKRDLQLLLHDRKGALTVWASVAHIDRAYNCFFAVSAAGYSEAEANRIVDGICRARRVRNANSENTGRYSVVMTEVLGKVRDSSIRSLARTQLRRHYAGRAEVIDDPQAGLMLWRDRLGHFNRDTLVAL